MKKNFLTRWRNNFFTGLAVVLPGLLSLLLLYWLFMNISSVTDVLLVFLPKTVTHANEGDGPVLWYFSLLGLAMAVLLICAIGNMTRIYIGQKIIQATDLLLLRTPLINKIYSTIKQVNEAFNSGNKSSFKQVVLIEYPRAGVYSMGFLTSDELRALSADKPHLPSNLVSVFIPTTPNPTSGFLVLVPAETVTKLDLSVADGIKFIISLGAIAPEQQQARMASLAK